MKRLENIKFPAKYNEIARDISALRTKVSSSIYQDGSERDRGDREGEIQFKGVLCELIAREYMNSKHKHFAFQPLIELLPLLNPYAPDMTWEGKTFDIKWGGKYFNVNYDDHNSSKKPQFYWFIVPISDTEAESYIFSWEEVSKWTLKEKYTKYYSYEVYR